MARNNMELPCLYKQTKGNQMKTIKAWHFVNDTLRDGSPISSDGEWLKHKGKIAICSSGLHASKKVIDALSYAPGSTICRVECRGEIVEQEDKLVCRERKILWRIDTDELLRRFARKCALDVIHLWDAPEIVVEYLKTGDENKRTPAWDAALDAASLAWSTAWSAARAAARTAAQAAASAAWYAVWDAASAASRDAAWSASWDPAWDAARDASWDAAMAAAWTAARVEMLEKFNRRLTAMVCAEYRKGKEGGNYK